MGNGGLMKKLNTPSKDAIFMESKLMQQIRRIKYVRHFP
jgi:hypothetical protein